MSKYYRLFPAVAGDIGEKTQHDGTEIPPVPSTTHRLHHRVRVWIGDDITRCEWFLVVTDKLRDILQTRDLSGYEIEELIVTRSRKSEEIQPDIELPEFHWLRVTGDLGVDDFGMGDDLWLVVSEDALDTLREGTLEHAEIEPYSPSDNERG
jgi:hypothetical protein